MSKFKSFTKEMRKRLGTDVKGFTLIEVIVVLVILAILMAIAIPNVLGYINKAKGTEAELATRNIFMAAQVEASEILKEDKTITAAKLNGDSGVHLKAICELANIKYVSGKITAVESSGTTGNVASKATDGDINVYIVVKNGAIDGVQYVPADVTDLTKAELADKIVNYHANGSINYGKNFDK